MRVAQKNALQARLTRSGGMFGSSCLDSAHQLQLSGDVGAAYAMAACSAGGAVCVADCGRLLFSGLLALV